MMVMTLKLWPSWLGMVPPFERWYVTHARVWGGGRRRPAPFRIPAHRAAGPGLAGTGAAVWGCGGRRSMRFAAPAPGGTSEDGATMLTPKPPTLLRASAGPSSIYGASAMSGIEDRYDRAKAFIAGQPDPASGGGTAGVLRRLCGAAVQTMAASGAGVTLMTGDGVRGAGAASDPGSARLEELQFTFGEGPCIDAYASRRPGSGPGLVDGAMTRWPVYAPAVHAQGLRAVFAFPLQIGAARLGVLDVFRDRAGALTSDELRQGVLLAEVTVAALLDQHEHDGIDAGVDDLDEAIAG